MALPAGYLAYNAITGQSPIQRAIGINTAVETNERTVSVPHNQGIRVEKSITVRRSPEEVYRFWRNFENLPRFMHHLESVTVLDTRRSHWVAKGPAGLTVEWDAEIINEVPNEVIGWRSLPNAEVPNAGSVRFRGIEGIASTEIQVEIEYAPPAGPIGAAIAALFGEEPNQQIEDDLRRLQQLMETSPISAAGSTTSGPEQV